MHVGTEHIGKAVNIHHYRSDNGSHVETYEYLIVDNNGNVSFTVSQLSYFAIEHMSGATASGGGTAENVVVGGVKSPKTGDSSRVFVILGVLAFAALGFAAAVKQKKRTQQ